MGHDPWLVALTGGSIHQIEAHPESVIDHPGLDDLDDRFADGLADGQQLPSSLFGEPPIPTESSIP